MNAQRMLNKLSMNTQGALKEHSMISSISQWSLCDLSMNTKFVHPEGEMAERSTSTQRSPTEPAFLLLLRDCWKMGQILYHLMVTQRSLSCVKEPPVRHGICSALDDVFVHLCLLLFYLGCGGMYNFNWPGCLTRQSVGDCFMTCH